MESRAGVVSKGATITVCLGFICFTVFLITVATAMYFHDTQVAKWCTELGKVDTMAVRQVSQCVGH